MKIKSCHIWLILSIFLTIFIFSNSIQPATESSARSGVIVGFICRIFNITGEMTRARVVFIVRKLAHMSEFCALGFCYGMHFLASGKKFSRYFRYVLLIGFLTACTDEFLQLFPEGRSCELRDVLIDFCGISLSLLPVYVISRFKKNHSE